MNQQSRGMNEQIFVALQAYEALKAQQLKIAFSANNNNKGLSFTDIVHCARTPLDKKSQQQLQDINQSIDYRRKYRFVLQQIASIYSPQQVAAASPDHLLARDASEFSLKLEELAEQVVKLKVSLKPGYEQESKTLHLHCEAEEAFVTISLDKASNDAYFANFERDSEEYNALLNPFSQIYIVCD
jgi:hypothetical protein